MRPWTAPISVPWQGLLCGMLILCLGRAWSGPFEASHWWPLLASDALMLIRLFAVWLLLSLLMLRLSQRVQWWVHGLLGTLLWSILTGLEVYFDHAGVPLGADVFAYSWDEISTTLSGTRISPSKILLLAWALACIAWWALLRAPVVRSAPPTAWWAAFGLVWLGSWMLPTQVAQAEVGKAWQAHNKLQYWVDAVLGQVMTVDAPNPEVADHPFERTEATLDTLGPLMQLDAKMPPHWVILVVEGLGRSFSGPGARLGSFTPELDRLAERSLYWENFLAPQGRTFAVLPSVLSSLPFGDHGQFPKPHHSLPAWLKRNGYFLRYFTGTNLAFDHQGDFLKSLGFDVLSSQADFGAQEKISEWGYADGDLLAQVSAQPWPERPSLTVVQTMSMHSPFKVPRMDDYRVKARERMRSLKWEGEALQEGLRYLDVYASILHTDEAIGHFMRQLQRSAAGRNTLVLITGDHRLPEIPMQMHLERYHVPLLVHGPMVRQPLRIKSVSSHFDLAPSIQALLSRQYGWRTPRQVHWMGAGLDVHPTFRNQHVIPMKQTKTELVDLISGEYVLHRDQLLNLQDGMTAEPDANAEMRAELHKTLSTFKAKLRRSQSEAGYVRELSPQAWVRYEDLEQSWHQGQRVAHFKGISASGLQVLADRAEGLTVQVTLIHAGEQPSPMFVPLLVITDDRGDQQAEFSGPAMSLAAGEVKELTLTMPRPTLGVGAHHLSLVVSHPDTGKSIGRGQYHVALRP